MHFIDFNKEAVEFYLRSLTPQAIPAFGKMSPQHMVEHLSLVVSLSNGKRKLKPVTSEEKWPAYKTFLVGLTPLPLGVKAPYLGDDLPKLYFPDLKQAKQRLIKEIDDFYLYFESNPQAEPVHPVFGPLNYPLWIRFHQKHLTHHFGQFNLLKTEEFI